MDFENPTSQDQTLSSTHISAEGNHNLTRNDRAKLAEIHFERYGVQSDFIDDSDATAGDIKDSEVEEEIVMEEEEPNQPPSPIAVPWTTDMERALKRGRAHHKEQEEKHEGYPWSEETIKGS